MTPSLLPTLALFGQFGWQEVVVLAILGILIFGKRLPEVGKSLGRGIVEFKKGLAGLEDEVSQATTRTPPQIEKRDTPTSDQAQAPASTPEKTASGGSTPA